MAKVILFIGIILFNSALGFLSGWFIAYSIHHMNTHSSIWVLSLPLSIMLGGFGVYFFYQFFIKGYSSGFGASNKDLL